MKIDRIERLESVEQANLKELLETHRPWLHENVEDMPARTIGLILPEGSVTLRHTANEDQGVAYYVGITGLNQKAVRNIMSRATEQLGKPLSHRWGPTGPRGEVSAIAIYSSNTNQIPLHPIFRDKKWESDIEQLAHFLDLDESGIAELENLIYQIWQISIRISQPTRVRLEVGKVKFLSEYPTERKVELLHAAVRLWKKWE